VRRLRGRFGVGDDPPRLVVGELALPLSVRLGGEAQVARLGFCLGAHLLGPRSGCSLGLEADLPRGVFGGGEDRPDPGGDIGVHLVRLLWRFHARNPRGNAADPARSVYDPPVLRGLRPGSLAELDLRASRARRRSRSRRARAQARNRSRSRVRRLLITTSATLVATLAVVAGPEGASIIRHQFGDTSAKCPIPDRLRPAFLTASRAAGVQLPLLAAVAHTESRFDPSARSAAGAVGVLQLMPGTAAALHYDPEETSANVMAGAVYLKQLLSRFGSLDLALAAYNAGPTAVELAGRAPTRATAAYVDQVKTTLGEYGDCE
jgi:soluble lytic murein transglycosylase-like protein